MLLETRAPTVESASITSNTVAVESVTRRTRPTSPAALTTAAAGLTLNGVALVTSLNARGTSQRNISEKNRTISTLNRASLPCYGVALAAGLTWAVATLWPESKVTFEGGSPNAERQTGLWLRAAREF